MDCKQFRMQLRKVILQKTKYKLFIAVYIYHKDIK